MYVSSQTLQAEIFPPIYGPEEFPIEFYDRPDLTQLEPEEMGNQHNIYRFRDSSNSYEIRYILFRQTAQVENRSDLKIRSSVYKDYLSYYDPSGITAPLMFRLQDISTLVMIKLEVVEDSE